MSVHTFDSCEEAYDACQCREEIKQGDILLIPSENVVGIADTWPIAISGETDILHSLDDTITLAEYIAKNFKRGA